MARLIAYNSTVNAGNDKMPQRGDVVEILPDGVHPGTSVLGNPQFVVIDVPGDPADYVDMVERDVAGLRGNMLRYRTRKLDLDNLALPDLAAVSTLSGAVLRAGLIDKEVVIDPMVIG
jgi:hypothetical protein